MTEELQQAIETIKRLVPDARGGLPYDLFILLSRMTPMCNVDLLIRNEAGDILLTWRDDEYYGQGWHIPGGIIRFKESIENRIEQVALTELNTPVTYDPTPLCVTPLMNEQRDERGHFISLLFNCRLKSELDPKTAFDPQNPKADQWGWHSTAPHNLLNVHKKMYKGVFKK